MLIRFYLLVFNFFIMDFYILGLPTLIMYDFLYLYVFYNVVCNKSNHNHIKCVYWKGQRFFQPYTLLFSRHFLHILQYVPSFLTSLSSGIHRHLHFVQFLYILFYTLSIHFLYTLFLYQVVAGGRDPLNCESVRMSYEEDTCHMRRRIHVSIHGESVRMFLKRVYQTKLFIVLVW